MRLTRLKVENHRRLADIEMMVRGHLVLVGANDVGKSSLLRCLDLVLGSSTAQLYSQITSSDFRALDEPLLIEAELEAFSDNDKALFSDEIRVDPTTKESRLIVRLTATIDDDDTVVIERAAPEGRTGRQLSRDQLLGIGWKFLGATAQTRDLRDGRKSALDDILQSIDLGEEKGTFETITAGLKSALGESKTLEELRSSLAEQLSKALPEAVAQGDLAFVPGASADDDVLSDVRLQVTKAGVPHDLSEQSDGMRALYAIALYDLMSVGASMVGIDEPEIHLHPSSQRSLARLLRANANQKIISTHSPDIVGAFEPDSIVVVRRGGEIVQPTTGFLSDDERMTVRLWVRDRLEPLTSRRVVVVEGISDRIVLERIAELTTRSLDRLGVSLIEANGAGDMGALDKLFGPNGFNVPMSQLIDEDAEADAADRLGIETSDLPAHGVWVSRADLEDEYVRALGPEAVWSALQASGQFSPNELANCTPTGEAGAYTESDIAEFCRRKKYKVKAALSVLPLFTAANAKDVDSIEDLLSAIAT